MPIITPDPESDLIAHQTTRVADGCLVEITITPPAVGEDSALLEVRVLDEPGGSLIGRACVMDLIASLDADAVVDALNAHFVSVTAGAVLDDAGSAVTIKTDATGVFCCSVSDLVDETIWVAAMQRPRSLLLDCEQAATCTFTS